MGPSIPRGPSAQRIQTEARLEEERIRFENEKRLFVERAGSYESVARDRLSGERGSFEYSAPVPVDAVSLQIPSRFNPSFNPQSYEQFAYADLSWFTAPNLGINYDTHTGTRANQAVLPYVTIPNNAGGRKRPGFGTASIAR